MFDNLLNSKFYNKCKHAIKCIRTRLDLVRRKKQAMVRFMKKDIADLLANGHNSHALGRMDDIIIEMNQASCYDMIEQFCEYIVKQLNSLQKQSECPQEALEAVSTLIFAAARFPDLPELCDLRHIFTERYGSSIESFVNAEFVQKLQDKSFSKEERLQAMRNIAEEFSVVLDTKALERKLSGAAQTKHDLPKKGSFKRVELEASAPNGYKVDKHTMHERKSKAPSGGLHEQKQEMQLKPKDIHVNPDGVGRLVEKSRKTYSDKPNDMECLDKQMNVQNEIKKDNKKDGHPRELMNAEELDINGLKKKQGAGSVKSPEREINRIVPQHTKPKETEMEGSIGKVNGKGDHLHRSRMADGPDHDWGYADLGLKTLGQEKQGIDSASPLNGKTVSKAPPYTKCYGAMSEKSAEDNNGFLHDRPQQHVPGLGPSVQDRQQVPGKAVNMRPPYVKPKFSMSSVHENPIDQAGNDSNKHNVAEQTDRPRGLVDDDAHHPFSVRKKYAKPPAFAGPYEESPNDRKMSNRTPGGRRRHSSRPHGAYDDDYDLKGVYMQPEEGNGVNDAAGNEKHVQRTPSDRRKNSSRRKGSACNDDQEAEDDEADNAIDFGNLLPQTSSGHRRHKSRGTDAHKGGRDDEERMMDKLLMHYSKKGFDKEDRRARTKSRAPGADKAADGNGAQSNRESSMHPPERAISLPMDSANPGEKPKVPARSNSMQPDMLGPRGVHVHPRMPDFDELAARISALRKA